MFRMIAISQPWRHGRYFQTEGQRILLQNSFTATASGKCTMQIESVLVLIFLCARSIQSEKNPPSLLPPESAAPKSASCGVTAVPLDELWSRRCVEQLLKLAYDIGNLPDNRCLKRALADRTMEKTWKTYKYMGFAKADVLADGNVWESGAAELNSNANRYVDDTYGIRNLSLGFRCQSSEGSS